MIKKTDFFGCVAKHNLERFHSECIVWGFKNSKEMLKSFIKKTTQNPDLDIEAAQAFSETSDIDVLIYYKSEGKDYLIYVENKVKANEGKKKITKKTLEDLGLNKDLTIEKFKETYNLKRNYLSQTEYYYLRDKTNIEKKVSKEIDIENIEEWHYVYLVPALEDTTENSRNIWNESFDKPNPWLNLSYVDIINCMPNNIDKAEDDIDKAEDDIEKAKKKADNIIFKQYKAHLKKEFSESYVKNENSDPKERIIEITEGSEHRVDIKNDTLSSQNLNLVLDEEVETTILDASGMQIHFLKLKDSLAKFCDDKIDEKYKFEVEFLTETGNNGSYLIQAYSVIKLENPNPSIFKKTGPIDFRIGFQFEQNEKDKDKFKFYFADLEYKPGLVKNQTEYRRFVQEILKAVFDKGYLKDDQKCKINKDENLKFNGSKTKSFCSFSADCKFENSDEIEEKFTAAILDLISKIKVKSLEEHIQLLSK